MPKALKTALFTVHYPDGRVADQEAVLFDEPSVWCSSEFNFSAGYRVYFASEIPDVKWIERYDPVLYVYLIGIGEFADFDAVKKFYEHNMLAKITDWVEVEH